MQVFLVASKSHARATKRERGSEEKTKVSTVEHGGIFAFNYFDGTILSETNSEVRSKSRKLLFSEKNYQSEV